MKEIKEIKVKAKVIKATTRKVEKITCDVLGCGVTINEKGYGFRGKCDLCGRDICRGHTTYDPDEPGDYPENYCPTCVELWIPARREMKNRHWDEEEKLEAKVKKLSLAKEL